MIPADVDAGETAAHGDCRKADFGALLCPCEPSLDRGVNRESRSSELLPAGRLEQLAMLP